MIAYFDTSALLPLIVDEPASEVAARVWDVADRVVSVRLVYPEARAALARAHRLGRITSRRLQSAVVQLDRLLDQLDVVEITARLARRAGELAEHQSLRGYDAVHLAGAELINSRDTVLVAGDTRLCDAGERLWINVARL
ncbi:MAG: type II toxin-antitoxin system VapC family toxin [Actinobacteria bacterium]|nr:type II toxin-antitoxin system VapC family toxin [Actinomycetota bacterium]